MLDFPDYAALALMLILLLQTVHNHLEMNKLKQKIARDHFAMDYAKYGPVEKTAALVDVIQARANYPGLDIVVVHSPFGYYIMLTDAAAVAVRYNKTLKIIWED